MTMPKENKEIKETRQTNNQRGIINDILTQANLYEKIFNTNFQTTDEPPSKILDLSTIYRETIPPTSLKNLNFHPKNAEDFFNLPLSEFISYLETLPLNPDEKQQIIRGWLENRIIQVYGLKLENISYEPTKIYQLKKENRLPEILKEIQKIGSVEDWDNFYRFAQKIADATTIEKISEFENSLENSILNNQLSKNPEKQKKLYDRLKQLAEEKRKLLQKKQEKEQQKEKGEKPKKLTKEERKQMITEFSNALKQTLEYLRWAYSLKGKKMPKIVEFVLKIIDEYRNFSFTDTPETFRLAQLFWILRLNRVIDFSDFPPDVSKRIKRFFKTILDKSLLSEAAGFWLEKNINIPHLQINFLEDNKKNKLSEQTINPIIESLISTLKTLPNWAKKEKIKINIIFDDRRLYKLEINFSSNKSIEEQIREFLSSYISLPQNPDDIFNLIQQAYHYGPISKKTREFQKYFGHPERFLFSENYENDDLSIRINLHPEENPSLSPISLFIVEHHQLLINFDVFEKGLKISGKFAHKHFDGIPAKNFFKKFLSSLKEKFPYKEELPPEYFSQNKYKGEYPIFESSATHIVKNILSEKIDGFNPTFIYALALAIGNNIDHFHFLVNGPDIFSKYGPYSNVQPALILLEPIKQVIDKIKNNETITEEDKQKVQEWAEKIKEEIERAKKGLSTPAVIASVVGTKAEPLSKIAKIFHPGTNALVACGGMVSAIPNLEAPASNFSVEQLIFYTAKSDAYHQKINIINPPASMGVIGFNQSQAKKIPFSPEEEILQTEIIFTVRKNLSQAQRELKQWFEKNFEKFNPSSNLSKKFEQLIKEWDKLIQGIITLEKYFSYLADFFNSIPENKRKELGLETHFQIQQQMNQVLHESAEKSLSQIEKNIEIAEKLLKLAAK